MTLRCGAKAVAPLAGTDSEVSAASPDVPGSSIGRSASTKALATVARAKARTSATRTPRPTDAAASSAPLSVRCRPTMCPIAPNGTSGHT